MAELEQLVVEDANRTRERTRWPGAPYLGHVDSKHHVRLLAMTWLGLLPLEIEEGRWRGIPRRERLCKLGCGVVGDTRHFLNGCASLKSSCIQSLDRYSAEDGMAENPLTCWRTQARERE